MANLRQSMPQTAAWIDELRQTFGAEAINASIRNGMAGGSDFWASENGHEVGHRAPEGEAITADKMDLRPCDPTNCTCPACRAARATPQRRQKWAA